MYGVHLRFWPTLGITHGEEMDHTTQGEVPFFCVRAVASRVLAPNTHIHTQPHTFINTCMRKQAHTHTLARTCIQTYRLTYTDTDRHTTTHI